MATAVEWRQVAARIRTHPRDLEALATLYRYAVAEADYVLRRPRFKEIAPGDRDDIVHDVLAEKHDVIVAADSPAALFRRCLVNRAIDILRRWQARQVSAAPGKDGEGTSIPEPSVPPPQPISVDLRAVTAELLEGDQRHAQIFYAVVVLEETPNVVAAAYGETVANIYQIVSRLRRRLKLGEEGS
jgi:DNA-directed RNA polymerase specialized sigma24 family protein